MTKPQHEFTIDAGPGTLWKVKVCIWRTHKQLIDHRQKVERVCHVPEAFFYDFTATHKTREKMRDTGIIGELHFYAGKGLKLGNVVHESAHAACAYAFYCKLDIYQTRSGEEEFVKSVQHITDGIMWNLRRLKRRKK